ncbi:MAG: pseudouridine synthase [Conexibacter sp.]|jgi:23S rRNA pseudouridine2605 synthase|nr:pseudouridine synthase [Conexibacter sp.]
MRLAKFLAHAGIASRRAAEQLIAAGRVTVGGAVVRDPARDVDEHSGVAFDGEPVRREESHVVYALHKPAGVVSTASDTHGRPTVIDLVADPRRLYPVGRLDADSTGLILLTNDGELANRLMHPRFEVPKTYRVVLGGKPIGDRAIRALREGVRLEDGMTAPARVKRLAGHQIELTIHEGRKRQVRRMCEAVGCPVSSLTRVAFGPLALGDLRVGKSRRLSGPELQALTEATQPPEARAASRRRGA